MSIEVAALSRSIGTTHLRISLSLVKQKSQRGSFYFSAALRRQELMTSF